MTDVTSSSFRFPAVQRKKVTAAFDGGRITSDGGVLLLAQAEREMDICRQLATCIADRRDPSRVVHKLDDILRARVRRLPAATRTPTTSTPCVTIPASAWRWASYRVRARALPANRR